MFGAHTEFFDRESSKRKRAREAVVALDFFCRLRAAGGTYAKYGFTAIAAARMISAPQLHKARP
jgi:hypothetical protein